jgi:hypothetical protein
VVGELAKRGDPSLSVVAFDVEHDSKGGLRFEERPFVVMRDGAFVDMGKVLAPLSLAK